MAEASRFMVDNFWLSSPWMEVDTNVDREKLAAEQNLDLTNVFGERMGKRLVDASLFTARDDSQALLGMVCCEARLWNGEALATGLQTEEMVKNAVSSVGPKQRRQYKDASVPEIVQGLLPNYEAVCYLSNLSVSPASRGQGIAQLLCAAVDEQARLWGFSSVVLKVETANQAALKLYGKLGFELEREVSEEPAPRVDSASSTFTEISVDSKILRKFLTE